MECCDCGGGISLLSLVPSMIKGIRSSLSCPPVQFDHNNDNYGRKQTPRDLIRCGDDPVM